MGNCMFPGNGNGETKGMLKVITAARTGIYQCNQYGQMGVSHGLNLGMENGAFSSEADLDLVSEGTVSGRMSPTMEVLPSQEKGIWKVKLVTTAEHLNEIFSHQSNTEALIEKVRLKAAKSRGNKTQTHEPRDYQIGCFGRVCYSFSKTPLEAMPEMPVDVLQGGSMVVIPSEACQEEEAKNLSREGSVQNYVQ